jgi:hypothetical protein
MIAVGVTVLRRRSLTAFVKASLTAPFARLRRA